MAIQGYIVLEDTRIDFSIDPYNKAKVKIADDFTGAEEEYTCDGPNFMLALWIALSFTGEASHEDYAKAETVQPKNPALRFIP